MKNELLSITTNINTEKQLMTFDDLSHALENNLIESNIDSQIAEKILEAERDWVVPMFNLNSLIHLKRKLEIKHLKVICQNCRTDIK